MRLLVTGGAGFIGSNYIRKIVDGSFQGIVDITVLDKLTYAGTLTNLSLLPEDSFRFVQGDICDGDLMNELCKDADAVVNFAAESHVDRSIVGAKDFVRTNILGTQTLLEAARLNGVGTFIQVSTDEVYGSISKGSWSEDSPLRPNSPYSASKASGDLIARAYQQTYSMDVRITRSSNTYGPNQFPEKLIPLFVTKLINGFKVPLYGDGKNTRDWLHVNDHCEGIHLVLTKGRSGEIYNIGGGHELSNIALTQLILRQFSLDTSHIEFVQDRLGHDRRYSLAFNKISVELGYQPSVTFEEGLLDTIKWYRENEKWWRPLIMSGPLM